ncbi:MAG: hypothetical protein IJU84_04555, partial [Clostridia bacterium]|nr:hypothetical protein [Clostridia bacterium]
MKKLFITALCLVIAAAMCLTGCAPAEDTSESGNHGGNVEPEAVAFAEINETLTPGSYTLGATVTPAEASQAVIFSVIGTAAGVTLTGNTLTVSENAPDGVTFRVKVAAQTDPTVSATKTFTISNTAPAATAITTEAELRAMSLNGSYVLGGNIVLTSPWVPLGTPDNEETGTTGVGFAGTLDGAGYTISGIVIEGIDKGNEGANVGFFNKIESTGVIKNIGFESGTGENDGLSARCWSAAVAGYNFGLIENVYTNVKVTMTAAPGCPGGAMVSTNHGTIKNSYAIGQVTVAEGGTHGASFVCANENTVTNSYFLNTAGNCAIGWQKQQNPN